MFNLGDIMVCTFFGHWLISDSIVPKIEEAIVDLIENHGVNKFYVGTHGGFDYKSFVILQKLSEKYDIDYKQVLSRVPVKRQEYDMTDYSLAVVPEGIEKAPPRFGIDYRNRWMIKQADYVITYINNTIESNAAKYAEIAEKRGKNIIKLGKY